MRVSGPARYWDGDSVSLSQGCDFLRVAEVRLGSDFVSHCNFDRDVRTDRC